MRSSQRAVGGSDAFRDQRRQTPDAFADLVCRRVGKIQTQRIFLWGIEPERFAGDEGDFLHVGPANEITSGDCVDLQNLPHGRLGLSSPALAPGQTRLVSWQKSFRTRARRQPGQCRRKRFDHHLPGRSRTKSLPCPQQNIFRMPRLRDPENPLQAANLPRRHSRTINCPGARRTPPRERVAAPASAPAARSGNCVSRLPYRIIIAILANPVK